MGFDALFCRKLEQVFHLHCGNKWSYSTHICNLIGNKYKVFKKAVHFLSPFEKPRKNNNSSMTTNLHHFLLQSQPQQPYTATTINPIVPYKPKPSKKPDPLTLPKPSTIPLCTECSKRSSSWKALFGHMRCHPERLPPPHFRCRETEYRPARFSGKEYEVASSLIMLVNGPQPKAHSGSFGLKDFAARGPAHNHKCCVCLRGHMRCHWDRVEENCDFDECCFC